MLEGWYRKGRKRFKQVATEADLESAEFFQQYHLYASDVDTGEASAQSVTCSMGAGGTHTTARTSPPLVLWNSWL